VDGHVNSRTVLWRQDVIALRCQFHLRAKERINCCRTQCDQEIRAHDVDFGTEPPGAAPDLPRISWLSPSTDRAADCSCPFGTTRSLRNLMLIGNHTG